MFRAYISIKKESKSDESIKKILGIVHKHYKKISTTDNMTLNIAVIYGSVRDGRQGIKAANIASWF